MVMGSYHTNEDHWQSNELFKNICHPFLSGIGSAVFPLHPRKQPLNLEPNCNFQYYCSLAFAAPAPLLFQGEK